MKLAFVTDNGFSYRNGNYFYNGANIQHYSTVTKHFKDITFIARNNPYEQSSYIISRKYKVYLINSIADRKYFFRNYKELDRVLEDVIKKSDIVMCFGINGYIAYKKAIKYKKPIIAYVGGCVYDTLKNMDSKLKRILAPTIRSMIKEMVKNASYVHYVDKYLIERYPTNGEYLICPSVKINIDHAAYSNRMRKIYSLKKPITIGLIGYTHNKIKGIDVAIKAISVLGKDYKLQVVGRGDYSWLVDLARTLKVENQIEFLGVLPNREDIFNWLDSIDIYIQPSVTEGMPRATIEAMSRGCPVISTNVGGLKSVINKRFQIEVGNYTQLANKISKLSLNQDLMLESATKNFNEAKKFTSEILDIKRDRFYQYIKHQILENVYL